MESVWTYIEKVVVSLTSLAVINKLVGRKMYARYSTEEALGKESLSRSFVDYPSASWKSRRRVQIPRSRRGHIEPEHQKRKRKRKR